MCIRDRDYASNQKVIDRFFREGIERAVDTEDLITIGMRGDGDTPMGLSLIHILSIVYGMSNTCLTMTVTLTLIMTDYFVCLLLCI